MENTVITNKVIYETEFESIVKEDRDDGDLWLSDKNSFFRVVDEVWHTGGQTLKLGKKYKVTLKIEEVE